MFASCRQWAKLHESMGQLLDVIDSGTTPLRQVALSILSAYLMSHAIAALYAWTRRGQEHSRNFVKALVIGGIVGAMIMLAIGNSLARGVGIVGALALIRFRTNLRDPLDMIFIFAAFAAGISAGAGNIETGFVGTAIFLLVVYVLHISGGGTSQVEADLRLRIVNVGDADGEAVVKDILRGQTNGFALLKRRTVVAKERAKDKDKDKDKAAEKTADQTVDKTEHRLMYRVVLRHTDDEAALARALSQVPSVSEVALSLDDATPGTSAGGDDD
jgi:uncharacterized membrane protein YhiD involved in acid resistance